MEFWEWANRKKIASACCNNSQTSSRTRKACPSICWCEPKGRPERFTRIGCGILAFAGNAGLDIIGHSGAWGAQMLAVPALGMVLSGTVNQRGVKPAWMIEIAEALAACPRDAAGASQ